METGCDDVLVPTVSLTYSFSADCKFCQVELIFSSSCLVTLCCHAVLQVDYQYDPTTASYIQMLRHDQKLFSSNLGILLKWSPFVSEAELLKQVRNEYVFISEIFIANC